MSVERSTIASRRPSGPATASCTRAVLPGCFIRFPETGPGGSTAHPNKERTTTAHLLNKKETIIKYLAIFAAIFVAFSLPASAAESEIRKVVYPGFTLWLDCERRGVAIAYYEIGPDSGDIKSNHSFKFDKRHLDCQQTSTKTYNSPEDADEKYDLGHIVPANHLDNDKDAYKASYFMTNVVPQNRTLNQWGAWRKTENLIECWRDESKAPLKIWIGVLWGDVKTNDHFKDSHGIVTPDAFVKLVYRPGDDGGNAIAWKLPNQSIASGKLMEHKVSIKEAADEFDRLLKFPEMDVVRKAKPAHWRNEIKNCDLS